MLQGKTVIVTGVGVGLGRECVDRRAPRGRQRRAWRPARRRRSRRRRPSSIPSGERVDGACRPTSPTPTRAPRSSRSPQERFGSRRRARSRSRRSSTCSAGCTTPKLDDWRTAFETNVLGALTVLRPVAEAMKARGGGAVVLIGSQSMFKPSLPQAGYAASKGALLSDDVLPRRRARRRQHPLQHGRAVVDVGPARRRCSSRARPSRRASRWRRRSTTSSAASRSRRMTEDGEVADVAMFFASDHAKAVTGQHLMVNAGEMMR